MKGLKTNQLLLVLAAAVLIIVIIIGITIKSNDIEYQLTTEQTLKELNNKDNIIDYATLMNAKGASGVPDSTVNGSQGTVSNNSSGLKSMINVGSAVFIDVRNPQEYNFKHYGEAINIPSEKILNENYLDEIRDMEEQGNTIIIYGATPQQAAGPWMLLKQIGIVKVKMFSGTFDQLVAEQSSPLTVSNETPLINLSALNKKVESGLPAVIKAPKKTVAKKAVVPVMAEPSSGGGC